MVAAIDAYEMYFNGGLCLMVIELLLRCILFVVQNGTFLAHYCRN